MATSCASETGFNGFITQDIDRSDFAGLDDFWEFND